MSILHAIILGIVQGLCEFLPISSSGHLVLLQRIFGISEGALFFDSMLHVGTLIAVCIYFRGVLLRILKKPFSKYPMFIVLATIPTVLVALLFGDFIEKAFSGAFLGVSFLITACVLFICVRLPKQKRTIQDMTIFDTLVVGLSQSLAIVPGISRSGATLTGGLSRGLDQGFAAEFSFLMSIPAILGSIVLQAKDVAKVGLGDATVGTIIIGTIFAFFSGFIAINLMMRLIKKNKLMGFSIYCAALGLLIIVDQLFTHVFF